MDDSASAADGPPGDEEVEVLPDPLVTPELFREWRSPRYGLTNPERMNNPVWEWLIRARITAFQATERLSGPCASDAGPGWSFERFGQSTTELPDGRKIQIAGEHEDHYDPDFHIHNDVVVRHPDGRIDIFGYPRATFPATDNHSATLVGTRIFIIGSLGYPHQRQPGMTPVFSLDLSTWEMTSLPTSGTPPGWIHGHRACLEDDGRSILLQGGNVDPGDTGIGFIENFDDWKLHLEDGRWERMTQRPWQCWKCHRTDCQPIHLWEIQQALWSRSIGWETELGDAVTALTEELGAPPRLDVMETLFEPPHPHDAVASAEDKYNVRRIRIDDVVVYYRWEWDHIQLTVEGTLPQQVVDSLVRDLEEKLSLLENSPCHATNTRERMGALTPAPRPEPSDPRST